MNYLVYSVLKGKDGFIELIGYSIIIFIVNVFIAKIYGIFVNMKDMPKSGSIFIFLGFSWGISVMTLIKKNINKRVDIYRHLNLVEYIGEITFLKFFTILITFFQLYLILSKTIFELN
ncbi:hypothetical protein FFWV33_06865 [Flavobacterium faecale]|uniref:Uncharacterized protein n=1 Tax=Flavobacterium faecale TaxID=1355330 RepID=A0A2S1LBZ0_9FLAO|nr:hypothetical protein FFWV33_06865 [Flavobacterium faecale]